jgi:hypothetical protein
MREPSECEIHLLGSFSLRILSKPICVCRRSFSLGKKQNFTLVMKYKTLLNSVVSSLAVLRKICMMGIRYEPEPSPSLLSAAEWPPTESRFEDRMISIKEAAEFCSVQELFIRKAIYRRELKVVILGPKAHRLWISDLIRWAKTKQEK